MTRYQSDACRNAQMDALDTQRGASTRVEIRSGVPDGVGGAGTLLGLLTGNASGWAGASSAGVLTSNAITSDTSADATGTAGHYELLTSASTWLESGVIDGDGSTDGVALDNLSIAALQVIQMSGDWVNTAAFDDGV